MTPPEKALICTPYYGGVDLEHIRAIAEMGKLGWEQVQITGCALLDHAFGALVGIALQQQSRFDMVLFIESDIIFAPAEAIELVSAARFNNAMVGAPCIIKNPRGKLMVSGLEAETVRFGDRGHLYKCDGLPLGFTAIPMHWLCQVVEHFCPEGPCRADNGGDIWPVFESTVNVAADGHRELMTQDYSFCRKLEAVGCPRYLDTRRRIVHKGAYPYTVEDACWSVPMIDDLEVRFVYGELKVNSLDALDSAGVVRQAPSTCGIVQPPK